MDPILKKFMEAVEYPKVLARLAEGCQTAPGRAALEGLAPLTDASVLGERLERTRELQERVPKDGAPPVPDPGEFLGAFGRARSQGEALSGPELAVLSRFLGEVVKLRRYLAQGEPVPPRIQEWLGRLDPLPGLREALDRRVDGKGGLKDSASPELGRLRASLRDLGEAAQDFYRDLLQSGAAEALQERIVTEREGRFVVPVKRERQSAIPGLVHGFSATGSTLFIEPQGAVEANNRIREAQLREDEEARRILREATQEVMEKADPLAACLAACAEVDLHSGLALFATVFDASLLEPQGEDLRLAGARHPLLCLEAGEAFRKKVVPLDLALTGGTKVLLVSGPNAGGKTVALKTVGLACLMAQAGIPVPARAVSQVPPLAHFDTDLEDEQDLKGGLSSYAAKLLALKRMVEKAAPGALFLLDELGAGTDPKEGGALGLACLEAIREKGGRVMANTHQPLLKLLTQEEQGMANAAMLFDEGTGSPTFRMAEGVPGRSHALGLAGRLGFPQGVLERAKAHLPQGEADLSELLARWGRDTQAAQEARREAERVRDAAKRTEAELLTAKRQIREEAKRIKREAQVEAEGLLKNTRRKMEHLIQGVKPPAEGGVDKAKVNQARGEVNRRMRNLAPPPVKAYVEVRELREGDKVFFKPGNAEVAVVSADEEAMTAVIRMGNGMKLTCKYSDLGLPSKGPAPVHRPRPAAASPGMHAKALEGKGKLELDVRGKMVDQALPLLDKFLDDALLVGLPFVRILHGKGTGALKDAIHKHLPSAHPGVEFALAEQAQGGAGVTVVRFKT